ncbi:hypothetical protein JIN85_02640 [Luteolibacter pohnpeiensis]|uniref:PEP-CTERM sorting domain-containing protein n=1 Tax=Luteolibacter pohnpeiensis TaxID=454153 RepID=A0A934S522_9BACT|nr:hypothetical protein [Luteolibacter pohnpeiensis]MBK1881294.1 hypothetical protein [Luteolibacter pohnpeiensis]
MKLTKYALALGIISGSAITTATAGTYVSEGVYGNPFETITGTAATSIWSDVSENVHSSGFSSWPGSSAWTATMSPNSTSGTTTDIEVERVSGSGSGLLDGGPYPSDDTVYFGGLRISDSTGGVLKAVEVDPVDDLSEVVFQLQLGEANGSDLTTTAPPVLRYTTSSGTYAITATIGSPASSFENGTYSNGEYDVDETVILNEYKFVFNLSAVSETILSFEVEWSQYMHSQLYGLQIDQKD